MKDKQTKQTRLDAFKEVCHRWLHIENDEYIDVVFGVVFANRLDAKPVWLYLVAPPGGGKTEIIQSFARHSTIYALTKLTENTLVSGKITEPGEEDASLLPKLHGKILVIKDFTVILTGRHDKAVEIFGQLRDVYDGSCRGAYGTGKDTEYKSKFGIIAAVTSVIDKHLHLLSSLGERFLTYRLPKLSEAETKARTLLAAENRSVKQQEEELKNAAHAVLDLNPEPASISDELKQELAEMAQFVAIARTGIRRDRQTKEIEALPDPEVPTRLVKQFVSLAQGIAMTRERKQVTPDEIRLVAKVAVDSIPPMRTKLLSCLMEVYPNSIHVDNLAQKLRLAESTVRAWLEELYVLEIVDKTKMDFSPVIPYDWKITNKYAELLKRFGI